MAGAGFKTFATGEVLTAANVNTYLMQQTVMVFDDATARTTALGANVSEGMLSYLKDTNQVEVYNGSSWVASDDPNAIQNTIVDAKGDLITATAADTPARLAVGTNGQVLTADSTTATGLKWGTVSSGGMTLLHTGSLASVSTLDITSISQSYKDLIVDVFYYNPPSGNTYLRLRPNNQTSSFYYYAQNYGINANVSGTTNYISLGEGISSDGSVADFNSNRLVFVDYTRSYSQSQLILMYGGFADTTPERRSSNSTFIMEYGSAINQLYFYSGVNMQRGTIKVYGVS